MVNKWQVNQPKAISPCLNLNISLLNFCRVNLKHLQSQHQLPFWEAQAHILSVYQENGFGLRCLTVSQRQSSHQPSLANWECWKVTFANDRGAPTEPSKLPPQSLHLCMAIRSELQDRLILGSKQSRQHAGEAGSVDQLKTQEYVELTQLPGHGNINREAK